MSSGLEIYTLIHVGISLLAIGSGFVVCFGMLAGKRLDRWTAFFLATTVLTSLTGFGFPFTGFTPGIIIGIISLVVLAPAIYARYPGRLAGFWRPVYVVTAVIAQLPQFLRVDRAVIPESAGASLARSERIRATVSDRTGRRARWFYRARQPCRDQVSRAAGGQGVSWDRV